MKAFSILMLGLVAIGCGNGGKISGSDNTSSAIATTDEPQYLNVVIEPELFVTTGDGTGDPQLIHDNIDAQVANLIATIGETGDGTTRLLGFHHALPVWLIEGEWPGKVANIIAQSFRVASERNVAFHVAIETHYFWMSRPDLFNWFDPADPSYSDANRANVEWSDWQGTPSRYRYLDDGVPQNLDTPHMCYLSTKIQSEVARLGGMIGAAVKSGMDALADSGQSALFSGVTVTSEPSLDNYTNIDTFDPAMGQLMNQDGAPKVRYGYCSFTALGYSATSPPADLNAAAAAVNQRWIESWATAIRAGGVPTSKLYAHVAGAPGLAGDAFHNAPLDIAFNDACRPGWTSYPWGALTNDFEMLYDLLASNGDPHWGGTEAAPYDGMKSVPAYDYLRRHYDHGATVVTLNVGAPGNLADQLTQAVYSPDAIADYQRFLRGE